MKIEITASGPKANVLTDTNSQIKSAAAANPESQSVLYAVRDALSRELANDASDDEMEVKATVDLTITRKKREPVAGDTNIPEGMVLIDPNTLPTRVAPPSARPTPVTQPPMRGPGGPVTAAAGAPKPGVMETPTQPATGGSRS
jgi:hypothetical protein